MNKIKNTNENFNSKLKKRKKENLRKWLDNIKWIKFNIIRVSDGEETEKCTESLVNQIIAENFLNFGRYTNKQIHEAQMSQARSTQRAPHLGILQ